MRGAVQLLTPAHRAGVGDAAELTRNRVLEIVRHLRPDAVRLDLPREFNLSFLLRSPHWCVNVIGQ